MAKFIKKNLGVEEIELKLISKMTEMSIEELEELKKIINEKT